MMSMPRVLLNPMRLPGKVPQTGQGRPVMVIPGMMTGDVSTTLLRRTLAAGGYRTEGWQQGINTGADEGKLARLEQRLADLHAETGQKVALIGWSLGGLYARVLGHRVPQHLAMVATIASPFSGNRHANRAWQLYNAINDHTVEAPPFAEDFSVKPPVHTVAIWSPIDGVVAPHTSHGLESERDVAVQIDASHIALGTSAKCIRQIVGIVDGVCGVE